MADAFEHLDWPEDIKGLSVVDGEFVVATADGGERARDRPIATVLERIRDHVGMDIVFISQFAAGERIIRHVVATPGNEHEFERGDRDPLEETYCKQIVDGRLPSSGKNLPPPDPRAATRDARRQVGAYITMPIEAPGGAVFGTLCCISRGALPQLGGRSEEQAVRSVAQLLSSVLARGE